MFRRDGGVMKLSRRLCNELSPRIAESITEHGQNCFIEELSNIKGNRAWGGGSVRVMRASVPNFGDWSRFSLSPVILTREGGNSERLIETSPAMKTCNFWRKPIATTMGASLQVDIAGCPQGFRLRFPMFPRDVT